MRISEYKKGDEKSILELFKIVFNKELDIKYWNWRFINNPQKKQSIQLVWNNNLLVGHYAVFPVEMICNNEKILSGLSMTTMTHPDYAGQGIFTKLAKELYNKEAQKNGMDLVWGFPNNNSHRGFVKNLEWKNILLIPSFSLQTSKIVGAKLSEKINKITEFKIQHESAYLKITQPFLLKVNKSQEYLNWRYVENPSVEYQIFEIEIEDVKYFFVAKLFNSFDFEGEKELDILEFNLPPNFNVIKECINHLIAYYHETEPVKINMWLPLNDSKQIDLEKIGFQNISPVTYMGFKTLRSGLNVNFENANNWSFSMGDSDVY